MGAAPTTFWDDLAEDLKDPEFLRAYVVESLRIETINRLVNELDKARDELDMSKADLARAISAEPAVVRRLLSAGHRNPTIGTVAEVAAALGMRVTLEPLPPEEIAQVTEPLHRGVSDNPAELAKSMHEKRSSARELCAS
ncbi:helix-turn-helix domain-containing protein [Amycolatopsis sp. NPDC003861]